MSSSWWLATRMIFPLLLHLEDVVNRFYAFVIQSIQRFIEEQNRGIFHNRLGNRQPLAHAQE